MGIFHSISSVFAFQLAFLTKSLVSLVYIALTFLISSSYEVFLTTSSFATLLSLLKLTGLAPSLSISNLSISSFRLVKSTFLVNFDVLAPVAFSSQIFFHN